LKPSEIFNSRRNNSIFPANLPTFSPPCPYRLPTMSRQCPDLHPTIPRLLIKNQETLSLFQEERSKTKDTRFKTQNPHFTYFIFFSPRLPRRQEKKWAEAVGSATGRFEIHACILFIHH
jgi:hypothetical protein